MNSKRKGNRFERECASILRAERTADISATIRGRSVKIEVKIGKDRQSADQKAYQEAIERAGGQYWLVRSFEEFMEYYGRN